MNELLSAISGEFATLQSGLASLLGQLQSVNGAVRRAQSTIADVGRTVEAVAPSPPPVAGAIPVPVDTPTIACLEETTPTGEAVTSAIVQEGTATERSEGETTVAPLEGEKPATVPSRPTVKMPRSWTEIRRLKGDKLRQVVEAVGGEFATGAGSAPKNYATIKSALNGRLD